MNADGQRFHLLLGEADWARGRVDDTTTLAEVWEMPVGDQPATAPGWDEERVELTLAPLRDPLAFTPGEVPLSPEVRRAAAADRFGNVYWIGDDATQLFVRSRGDGSTTRFWPDTRAQRPAPRLFVPHDDRVPVAVPYRALAATGDGWLIAASDIGLDSFDLVAGGPPLHFDWPAEDAPSVTDLEPRCESGLWLLDGPARRLFELDARASLVGAGLGEEVPELFQPVSGEARARAPAVAAEGHDLTALDPAIDPIAIAALPSGAVAILSRTPSALYLWTGEAAPQAGLPLDFVPHDMVAGNVLLRGSESVLRVLVSDATGNQLRAFRFETEDGPKLRETSESFPLRRHGGRALVSIEGNASYDSGDIPNWPQVVEKPRQQFRVRADFRSPVFDSGMPSAVWDRLRLDGCVPPGTRILVEARASDEADGLGAWVPQPSPILSRSGSELAAHSANALVATDPLAQHGTFELLFQRIEGRFLEVRLSLTSDGDSSPRLRALRASWPRVSWAERYLPALYREDPEPADFLERFLANMQGTTSVIEARMISAQALFDTRTAPVEALGWLAEWFDVALDPSWGEQRRRLFIAHAIRFFGWRGTMRGLESALALAFVQPLEGTLFSDEDCRCEGAIRIVESYRTRTLGRIGAGDTSSVVDPPTHDAGLTERENWKAFQQARAVTGLMATLPRLSVPPAHAANWAAFLKLQSHNRTLWQRFLAGRYRRLALLNQAHGSAWKRFGEVSLADTSLATLQARADWQEFEKELLPIDRTAHRFSVLLPVSATDATDAETLARREALARRIIALEKPAHTIFDIRFYFAMNRIGEARLGYDTAIGAGSRAPELLPGAILGKAYIGESFIGPDGLPLTPDRARLAC
ncbi:phage tail protein [Sphingomonas sp. HF-S4]|uniref:Phage tail protein n=1 Tax=Sphingomonas agrestis TaxID=3080540 RepID=A0ABU3Y4K7_9SPHN|nr:phage tail protein [Sphingomonas sp. HF-S4]MDV3456330.1 phage tail protein [Sphingomonas sp. HF-S4]